MDTRVISLFLDQQGLQEAEVRTGNTLQDLANAWDLGGYTLTVDGEPVPAMNWSSFTLDGAQAVWATRGQKGA